MSVKNPNVLLMEQTGSLSKILYQFYQLDRKYLILNPNWGKKELEDLKQKKKKLIQSFSATEIARYMLSDEIVNRIPMKGEFETFGQPESQKAFSSLKIITTLDWYEGLNTSQIKQKSKLSWKSVCGTLKLLRKRGLVDIQTKKDNKNNEKIYHLRRFRALSYLLYLIRWKFFKNQKDIEKILKNQDKRVTNFPKELENITLEVNSYSWSKIENKKKSRYKLQLSKMNKVLARSIKSLYLEQIICKLCFKKGMICMLEQTNNVELCCKKCGAIEKFNEKVFYSGTDLKKQSESFLDNRDYLRNR